MTDVLIIGAGPAGALAAALLAQRGFAVQVLERQRFPRFSIGESLLAQSLALLDDAGMLEAVQAAGFQYKNGAAFAWRERYTDFNFAEKSAPGPGHTFQVPRADFDQILINEAQRMGAQVEFETEIIAADFSDGPHIKARDRESCITEYRPRFVLDASGFGRVLPRLLDLEVPSQLPTRCALFTQVHDRIASGHIDRQKIRITTHPQHRDVWYWLIPFSNGKASIGVVASNAVLAAYPGSHDDQLWALHREDSALADILKNATPVFPAGLLRGYSASVKTMAGPGFALLGNAAEFLDPVFSSGVTIALKSAHLASDALSRQLHGEIVDWQADFETPLRLGVETFRGFVDGWYDGSLQDIIYHARQDTTIRRYICSILAGYAWDQTNPYVGHSRQRLRALAQTCRTTSSVAI